VIHYLLDTNAMIGLLKDRHSPLARRARRTDPRQIGLSAIVVHELYYGAYKSLRRTENLGRLEAIRLEVLPFDKEDGMAAGEIRAALAAAGTPIGPFDVLMAGQAKARGLVLVTDNVREFQRVAGLNFENWANPRA
jgi:tRNA(fMet)-specific endonuclease VapC